MDIFDIISGISLISGIFESRSGTKRMRAQLICPNCEEQQVLKTKEKFGVKIFLCYFCGGCFMTQDCLNNFINFQGEADWPDLFDLEADSGHTYESSPQKRLCPGCGDKMDNLQYKYNSGIWVDFCTHGHGVWLDSGEVKLIKDYAGSGADPLQTTMLQIPEDKGERFSSEVSQESFSPVAKPVSPPSQVREPLPEQPVSRPVAEDYTKDRHSTRQSLRDQNLISTSPSSGLDMKLRERKQEEMLQRNKKKLHEDLLSFLTPEEVENYRYKANMEWEKNCADWGTSFPMTDGFFKSKLKVYAKQDGFI